MRIWDGGGIMSIIVEIKHVKHDKQILGDR